MSLQVFQMTEDSLAMSSILEKIESLKTLQDPVRIEKEFVSALGKFLGYNLGTSFDIITQLATKVYSKELGSNLSEEESNKLKVLLLRRLIENLPFQYDNKGTRNLFRFYLLSMGIRGDLQYLFTKEYDNDDSNWTSPTNLDELETNKDLNPDDNYEELITSDQYATPHFFINVNSESLNPDVLNAINDIESLIEEIRPMNTVYRGIVSYMGTETYGESYTPNFIIDSIVSTKIKANASETNYNISIENVPIEFDIYDFLYYVRVAGLNYESMEFTNSNSDVLSYNSDWKIAKLKTESFATDNFIDPINNILKEITLYYNILLYNNMSGIDYTDIGVQFQLIKIVGDVEVPDPSGPTVLKNIGTVLNKQANIYVLNKLMDNTSKYKILITLTKT